MVDIHTRQRSPDVQEEPGSTSPLRRPAFLISAVLVALLLVVGIVLIGRSLFAGDPSTNPSVGTSAGPSSSGSASVPPSDPSVCGLPGVETTGTVPGPPAATWSLVGTTAAPSLDGTGPGIVDNDGFRRCFAHTPAGSLFAAANFTALGSKAGMQQKIAEYSIAKGPGRDVLLAAKNDAPTGGVRVQIAGFRVLDYTGETASIDIALRTSRGAIAGQVFDLVWEDGDWKARVTDQGELVNQIVQLPDLQGYTLWAGA